MSIEQRFDIPLIASLALKEKQIQQVYRPIIAVHKWFARRPGTLFRGLILSQFADHRLDEVYFKGHDFDGKVVADPLWEAEHPSSKPTASAATSMGLISIRWPRGSFGRKSNTSTIPPTKSGDKNRCRTRSRNRPSLPNGLPSFRGQGHCGKILPLGQNHPLRHVSKPYSYFPATLSPTIPATRTTCSSVLNAGI